MKRTLYFIIGIIIFQNSFAQLSGTLTIPSSTFSSLASLITALNQQGVSGQLVVNITSGYTEVAPINGYSLTASGSNSNSIIFQKSGTGLNPLIIAYSGGSGTPGSMNQDGIFRLIGSDFITIDGLDLLDTNSANPASMEFGYGLFKADAANGCWNNTIKNCVISLNRINNSSGTGPSSDGSRGIDVVNALSGVHNSVITVTTSTGSHSYNKFYGNTIQNCNIAVSLIGFADTWPFFNSDHGNEIGGSSVLDGNNLLNFGGGGISSASAAIRTLAQYNLSVQFNTISNNTGSGINHAATLRGIYLGTATGANATISNNTISLHGGGTNNQLSVIENVSGSGAASNSIVIQYNLIHNGTYASAVSPSYYGIWNSASPSVLSITHNSFVNNSSHASGGSTYLIYNNGTVTNSISITNNQIGFVYSGLNPYTGNMHSIYNSNGTTATCLNVSHNNFSNYYHLNATASGNLYFINNTNDSYSATFSDNTFTQLNLNHSGSEYLIYNSSATQSLLTVKNNSIVGAFQRNSATGAMYGYYANGNSLASSIHSIVANNFSNITSTVSGSGVFYGIHTSDGSASPYPKKIIRNNVISNVNSNSSGNFYGLYLDNLGDAGGVNSSEIYNNTVLGIARTGSIYGLYIAATVSPSYAAQIFTNEISYLNSTGNSCVIYSAYLAGGGTGIHFYKNKIAEVSASGTAAIVHGIYVTSANSTTLSNNIIGHLNAANSSANNAINGIYLNSGSILHSYYNTVYLNCLSTGGNFNSNALYTSTTLSLNLRNTILVNVSSGGTGITAAYRRSSTTLSTYSSSSNNNLFYAGSPGSTNVILQSGTTSYQTLVNLQTAVSPRDAASVTQSVSFLSVNAVSPNYLHVTPNINSLIESGALNISGISDDYDNQVRQGNTSYLGNGTAPDIGADEFEQNLSPCTGANAGTLSPVLSSVCAGQTISLLSNGYTLGTGLMFQWKVSNVSGGPYSNMNSGSGATTPEYNSAGLISGVYYFILETTCTNVPVSVISQQATVVVNAIPVATASVLNNLICVGQTLQLYGSPNNGGAYSWLGPNGYFSYSQNPNLLNCTSNASGNYSLTVVSNSCMSAPSTVSVQVSQVTLSVIANPQVLCAGNSSTLSVLGSANSFSWSTGAYTPSISVSPSQTTVYSVVATNTANCMISKQITVLLITPSIASIGSVICGSGGTVSLSVNAFTPSIVSWYTSSTSMISIFSGTTFTGNVSADTIFFAEANQSLSGCTSSRIPVSVTVSPYPVLTVSANPNLICPGKTTSLTVSGANTYSWISIGSGATRTVAPMTNVTYTVIGKNSFNCASTQTVSVLMLPMPLLTTQQTSTSVCPSSVLGFTANGAITYTWNTGSNGSITTVTPATNSTYTVYGSNPEGCVSSKTLAVTTRSVPVILMRQSGDSICPGQLITFTASGANSYTWLPGGIISTTFSTSPLVSSLVNVIGKSVNTCTQVAFALLTVLPCTDIEEHKNEIKNCEIFPNPTLNEINLSFNFEGLKMIQLINTQGELLEEISCNQLFLSMDLIKYPKGFYFLRIECAGELMLFKIIKA